MVQKIVPGEDFEVQNPNLEAKNAKSVAQRQKSRKAVSEHEFRFFFVYVRATDRIRATEKISTNGKGKKIIIYSIWKSLVSAKKV